LIVTKAHLSSPSDSNSYSALYTARGNNNNNNNNISQ
jgi:hypothetical protein